MHHDHGYRCDVDGLRAIAVIFVFLFHLDFAFASGGFVGVDVFYVISGFVIFRGLKNAPNFDRHFVFGFYWRRVRRLIPALLVTICACMIVGYAILTPREYASTAKSALAALFSVSNIYFADTLSYFADAARTLPLLHTWSLAVEEQFYLTIPWLLVLLTRFRKRESLFLTILTISSLSFLYNIFSSYFGFDERHAFYMPMSRFWEIGVGALVSLSPYKRTFSPAVTNLLSICGAGGLLLSFCLIDPRMVFPSFTALLPVLATALLILANPGEGSLQMRFLGSRPAQFLGRISYSLYLHHWLPIVFLGLLLGRDFYVHEKLLIICATIVTAYGSWRYVEIPCRNASLMGTQRFAAAASIVTLSVLATIGVILLTDGAAFRMNPQARAVHDGSATPADPVTGQTYLDFPQIRRSSIYAVGALKSPVDYILWGDSHAGMYVGHLAPDFARAGHAGFTVVMSDCPPILDVHFSKRKNQKECGQLSDAIYDWVKAGKVKVLIFSSRWAMLASEVRSPAEGILPKKIYGNADGAETTFDEAFRATVGKFTDLGVKILIIGPSPEFHFNVPNSLVRSMNLQLEMPKLHRKDFEKRQAIILKTMDSLSQQKGVSVFYPHKIFCPADICIPQMNNIPFYIDDDHLASEGVSRLMPSLLEQYERLMRAE